MNHKYLIVMGTFRTGSTFLAKALSAHKNIAVPSDPYFYFFKALRNEIFIREGCCGFDTECPVSDNFYSEFAEVNSKIKDYNLRIAIRRNRLSDILGNIGRLAKRDSPRLVPLLGRIKAETYNELFEGLIGIVRSAYGDKQTIYSGFKVTFAEQFLGPLLNTYPDLKCIYLTRDPRAVVASQHTYYDRFKNRKTFKGRGRYPLLYVIRNWRKSFAYLLDNIGRRKNLLSLRYEDIISHPEEYLRRICAFLGLDYDENMSDAAGYKDGQGKRWTQNSSYGTSTAISTKFMNKWKEMLRSEEVQLIEDLCSPEMGLLGYERVTRGDIFSSIFNAPHERIDEIDPWIRPYVDSYLFSRKEIERELLRSLLLNGEIESSGFNPRLLEKIYIGKNYLKKLEKAKIGGGRSVFYAAPAARF